MRAIEHSEFTQEDFDMARDLVLGLCIALGILVSGVACVACFYFMGG
jgi:hypothetical protein